MRIACWTTRATNTRAEYVIFVASLLQQRLHERASVLFYTCIACLVSLIQAKTVQPVSDYQGFGIAYCLHLE
jgi:hypothetical protein